MIKNRSTLIIGIVVIVTPYLGFPLWFKTILFVVLGLAIISLSIKINFPKKPIKRVRRKEKITDVYMENAPKIDKNSEKNERVVVRNTKNIENDEYIIE